MHPTRADVNEARPLDEVGADDRDRTRILSLGNASMPVVVLGQRWMIDRR
jgi:hypothetical protein